MQNPVLCSIATLVACLQLAVQALSDQTLANFLTESSKNSQWLIDTRRELHQWPELMFEEYNTSAYLSRALDSLDIPHKWVISKLSPA